MPTPTKTILIDVKYLIWETDLAVRYYPTYAVADVPDCQVLRGGTTTLCFRKQKITGEEYARLCSLDDESDIAEFFGLKERW